MRTGAMILGIIGGVIGLIWGIISWMVGGIVGGLSELLGLGGGTMALLGFLTFVFAIMGVVGGGIARAKPKVAGILMLIAGFGGFSFFYFSLFWLLPGILLIIGGVLAILGRKEIARD